MPVASCRTAATAAEALLGFLTTAMEMADLGVHGGGSFSSAVRMPGFAACTWTQLTPPQQAPSSCTEPSQRQARVLPPAAHCRYANACKRASKLEAGAHGTAPRHLGRDSLLIMVVVQDVALIIQQRRGRAHAWLRTGCMDVWAGCGWARAGPGGKQGGRAGVECHDGSRMTNGGKGLHKAVQERGINGARGFLMRRQQVALHSLHPTLACACPASMPSVCLSRARLSESYTRASSSPCTCTRAGVDEAHALSRRFRLLPRPGAAS